MFTGNQELEAEYTYLEAKLLQSCLILCDPMDYKPPDFSVHGIFQARILEWVAISFSSLSGGTQLNPQDEYLALLSRWCVLNCIPSKFDCWSPNPQGDGTGKWDLWTVIRFMGGRESGAIRMEFGPLWLSGEESTCECRRLRFDPWVGKIPWVRTWQPTPVFLPGKSMDRGAWWATVHRVTKSQTQLSDWVCKEGIPKSLSLSLSPSREDTARRQSSASQKGRPHQETKLATTLILDSPASRTVRTKLLLKAPSLWYFCYGILSSLIQQVIHSLVITSAPFSARNWMAWTRVLQLIH